MKKDVNNDHLNIKNTSKNTTEQKSSQSNKPFKITDIPRVNITLPSLCDSPDFISNANVPKRHHVSFAKEKQYDSQCNDKNRSDSIHCLTANETGIIETEQCDKSALPSPTHLETNDCSQIEYNIDQSMLDPKALLQCFNKDEASDLIPPPPEYSVDNCSYSPDDNWEPHASTYQDYYSQVNESYNNENTLELKPMNSVFDEISTTMYQVDDTPTEEVETWTLSPDDIAYDDYTRKNSMHSNKDLKSYLDFDRSYSNSTTSTRRGKLSQYKFNHKNKFKFG
jgi:hypothetical protein